MRILFVSSSSGSRGGGEFFLVYLAEALKADGHEVGLWLSSDPQMDGIVELFSGIGPVFRSPYENTFLRKTRSFSHLLPRATRMGPILDQWKSFRPDVLHLNKQCLEDGLDLLELANSYPVPQGCTIHITQSANALGAFMGRARDWVAGRALRAYGGEIWAIAANRAHELEQFLGNRRPITFIPNGVRIPDSGQIEEQSLRQREALADFLSGKGPLAVSVGRLEEQKDPFRFLEIMGQWKAVQPDLAAIWVGDGSLREQFESAIKEMGASEWISCVGWQENAAPFLSMADVYVHPARFEGLPFALLEAMAHGLPCVISPSLADDLKDMPRAIWIIAGEDPESWRPELTNLDRLAQRGRETRELAVRSFSIEAMARSYVRLYTDLIQKKGKPVA